MTNPNDPHGGQPVVTMGVPLENAKAAVIMSHGRGASPQDILTLVPYIDAPGVAYLAPTAAGNTWYPYSFLSPIEQNEPNLSSALALLADVLARVEAAGIPAENIMLLGFSQGACLSAEFAARNAQRYGGVAILTGGVIGPHETPRDYAGSLAGTPVFLGCSDVDFHIPLERAHETTAILTKLGGAVTERIYPDMGHTINEDELAFVRGMVARLVAE